MQSSGAHCDMPVTEPRLSRPEAGARPDAINFPKLYFQGVVGIGNARLTRVTREEDFISSGQR